MIKTATVFSNGDSTRLSTWSNVPYLFTETLMSKGVKVNRVDLSESAHLSQLFNKTVMLLLRNWQPATTYNYFRSSIHHADVRKRIKRALRQYQDSDVNIFLTYSFSSAALTSKPSILFCDWTYDYYLSHFICRKADPLERASIRREDEHVRHADLVISLFTTVASYMQTRYATGNICYLGNVVNSVVHPDKARCMGEKSVSKEIVFVGNRKYLQGATLLISAFRELIRNYPDLVLNIIGMEEADFSILPQGVKCFGYLDKGQSRQKDLYYKLLSRAKVFVNTTPKWGAFSAMLEAMHFYTPVITTPYAECVATFGQDMTFGNYCEDGTVDTLYTRLKSILGSKNYTALCENAHASVKEFSWDSYIDKVLSRTHETLNPKLSQKVHAP